MQCPQRSTIIPYHYHNRHINEHWVLSSWVMNLMLLYIKDHFCLCIKKSCRGSVCLCDVCQWSFRESTPLTALSWCVATTAQSEPVGAVFNNGHKQILGDCTWQYFTLCSDVMSKMGPSEEMVPLSCSCLRVSWLKCNYNKDIMKLKICEIHAGWELCKSDWFLEAF